MVKDNIRRIKDRIELACFRIYQDPKSITIIAVSKGRTPEQVKEAIDSGLLDLGENRVQEAILKYNELSAKRYTLNAIKWHMVGHLQTNKVKDAVKIFDLIHSVDSTRLAEEINNQAVKINKIQDVLLEIKTSPEATKFGLRPDEAIKVIKEISGFKNINIGGLMTIPPIVNNPEKARPYFKLLKELRDRINSLNVTPSPLYALSMGMTDDFEAAIEEGSNMVRLGRAIFEDRL